MVLPPLPTADIQVAVEVTVLTEEPEAITEQAVLAEEAEQALEVLEVTQVDITEAAAADSSPKAETLCLLGKFPEAVAAVASSLAVHLAVTEQLFLSTEGAMPNEIQSI